MDASWRGWLYASNEIDSKTSEWPVKHQGGDRVPARQGLQKSLREEEELVGFVLSLAFFRGARMSTGNQNALNGPIATAGEVFPDGAILDLVRNQESKSLELLVWRNEKARCGGQFEHRGKAYTPVAVDPTILGALQFPTSCATIGMPTSELFNDICQELDRYTDLPGAALSQIVYFIFATWFIERLPLAPLLWIVTPPAANAHVFLRLLASFCRRSLLLSAESSTGLWTLPMFLRPTILLDAAELTPPVQKFLYASKSRDIHFANRGQVLDFYCAKAVGSPEPLRDPLLGAFALQITLPPMRRALPNLTDAANSEIANRFQQDLLRYRLSNYHRIQAPNLAVEGLAVPTQTLARCLAMCIPDDEELQAGVVPLLRDQDREMQVERSLGLEVIILDALLLSCHDATRSILLASELAELTNRLLTQRGENLRVSPETVGWKLRSLGLRTEPIASGRKGLWLLNGVRAKIHSLALEYGRELSHNGGNSGCVQCLQFGDGQN